MKILGLQLPQINFSSGISFTDDRNQRLIDLCTSAKKNNILCGWGVSEIIHDITKLASYNIKFVSITKDEFQKCCNPYKMVVGVSILDVLIKIGINDTKDIFNKCSEVYKNKCNE